MEEKKQLCDVLSLINENMVQDILGIIEDGKPQPKEVAEMVAAAYKQGTDVFWESYQNELKENNRLREEIALIKDRLYNDFVNQVRHGN